MKRNKEREEISIIINDRNLEDLEFKFIRKGITIIIGENDVGKSNILDYIYYNNEEWDGLSEHVEEFKKTKACYKIPLLFSKNFHVLCPEHGSSLKKGEKERKLVEYSYKLYYFDLKTSVEFINKEMEEIMVPKVRSRSFNFYPFKKEEDEEADTEKEKPNTFLIVSETAKLRKTNKGFWEVDYGSDAKFTRNKEEEVIKYDGYNEYKGKHHPIENVGSGYLRHKKLKSLAKLLSLNEKKPVERLALIDEPELFLHPSLINDIANSIKELEKKGVTLVMTTHSPFFLSHFIHEKGVNVAIAKSKEGGLNKLMYFSEILEDAKKSIVQTWGWYCPCFRKEISEENFYENKWKSLLNEITLKIFFSKRVLFVEGITEYIFFNSAALRSKVPEFTDIEIIPIFSKFNYIFFSELAKKMELSYRFLLDKDESLIGEFPRVRSRLLRSMVLSREKRTKEEKIKKEKLFQNCQHINKCSREKLHTEFWAKHASWSLRRELEKESIVHDEKTDISWFPHDLEVFLSIDEKDPHVVSKELNIVSNLEFAVDNLDEEEIARLRELALKIN